MTSVFQNQSFERMKIFNRVFPIKNCTIQTTNLEDFYGEWDGLETVLPTDASQPVVFSHIISSRVERKTIWVILPTGMRFQKVLKDSKCPEMTFPRWEVTLPNGTVPEKPFVPEFVQELAMLGEGIDLLSVG